MYTCTNLYMDTELVIYNIYLWYVHMYIYIQFYTCVYIFIQLVLCICNYEYDDTSQQNTWLLNVEYDLPRAPSRCLQRRLGPFEGAVIPQDRGTGKSLVDTPEIQHISRLVFFWGCTLWYTNMIMENPHFLICHNISNEEINKVNGPCSTAR